jgi:DNA-binding HxlR family transcriptional regulator
MRSKTFEGMVCSIAGVLDALGDRWGILILRDISLGIRKYEDLRKSTDVTNATLSDRLTHLEKNGLIERRAYRARPIRHEYHLTMRGRDVVLAIVALAQIGDKWAIASDDGPPMKFVDRNTGRRVKLAVVEERSGKPVALKDIRPSPGPGADDRTLWRVAKFEESMQPQ